MCFPRLLSIAGAKELPKGHDVAIGCTMEIPACKGSMDRSIQHEDWVLVRAEESPSVRTEEERKLLP